MTSISGERSSGNNISLRGRRLGLRAPRFSVGLDDVDTRTDAGAAAAGGSSGEGGSTSSVATFVLHCQRRRALGRLRADLGDESSGHDDDNDDHDQVQVVTINQGVGNGAGGGTKGSTATDEPSMEQCVSLLAPHLAVFRQQSCADTENASGAAAGTGGGSASSSSANGGSDEIPPQLLRVARFFRWRWEPLKRALLRPPVTTTAAAASSTAAAASAASSGRNADAVIEVGSARHRLRLARALHGRGLLSLAEVDGLASAIKRQEREDNRFGNHMGNSNDHSEGGSGISDLTARLRLALSRLPSDASDNGVGTSTDRAKRGLRYAKGVLAEWRERSIIPTSTRSDDKSDSTGKTDCPSPEEVADWSLTAFTGIVLTNGIDGHCRNRQGVQFTTDDSDVESSFASFLLDRGTDPDSGVPAGKQLNLGLAIDEKIRAFLSPDHIDDLTEIHLLSLSRLLSHAPYRIVEDYLAESITLCSQQRGGVGMKQLPKLIASYLSLVGTERTDGPKLEAALRAGINEKLQDEQRRQSLVEQALSFLGLVALGAQFLLF
mmetsp:Transcript_12874/g.27273  ORF Transcript_12874/g.27273 Transcript_12874/m.27273 type:complete len:550 (+) Transcript_12874:45-1694(+)